MVIWNELEDLRRREDDARGYVEVKTPLIYDKALWERSGHWEKFRENMFLIPEEDHLFAIKPMNCPGHMVLFATRLRSYRELPLRYAEAAPLHRNERAGTLHGLTRVRHVTQDDAHIFCTREQIEDEIFGCLDYAKFLYDLFGARGAGSSSRRGPRTSSAPTRSGTSPRARSGGARAARARVHDQRGRRRVLRAEDRPAHDRLARPLVADGDDPARLASSRRGSDCRYVGADNAEHTPYVIHRALIGLVRALHRHPHRALRRRLPVLARAGADPDPAGGRGPPRGGARARGAARPYRVEVDESDETVGKRIRNAEVEKIPYVIVYGDKESDESLAIREHGGRADHPFAWLISGRNLLRWSPGKQGRNRLSPPSSRFGGSTDRLMRTSAAACQRIFRLMRRTITSLVKII